MDPRELERYKRPLLAKLEELSVTRPEAESPVAAAGVVEGDLIEQANADAEAELQLSLHKSDAHLLRAIEEALVRVRRGTFGACEVCQQPISKAHLSRVSTPLPRAQREVIKFESARCI